MATDIQIEREFKKNAILEAWKECERQAGGEGKGNMSAFANSYRGEYNGQPFKTNISSLRNYLGLIDRSKTRVSSTPNAPSTISYGNPATLDDVEAAYKLSITTLITNLEEQEQELSRELERVKTDLDKARERLTKFD